MNPRKSKAAKKRNKLTQKKLRFAFDLYNNSLASIQKHIDECRAEAAEKYKQQQNPTQTEQQFQDQAVKQLLNEKQDFHSHQMSALDIAVRRYIGQFHLSMFTEEDKAQSLAVIEYLLENGASIIDKETGETCLISVEHILSKAIDFIRVDHGKLAKLLITFLAKQNIDISKFSALFPDTNDKIPYIYKPLLSAKSFYQKDYIEVLALLISCGAKIEKELYFSDNSKMNILSATMQKASRCFEIAEYLLRVVKLYGEDFEENIESLLEIVFRLQDLAQLQFLIKVGMDLYSPQNIRSVLHMAAASGWAEGLKFLITTIQQQTNDPKVLTEMLNAKDDIGLRPLELAIFQGDEECIRLLSCYEQDPIHGEGLLTIAFLQDNTKAKAFLLRTLFSASPNSTNHEQEKMFVLDKVTIIFNMNRALDYNWENLSCSPLTALTIAKKHNTLKLFVSHGADPNAMLSDETTALWNASDYKDGEGIETFKTLLDLGANPFAVSMSSGEEKQYCNIFASLIWNHNISCLNLVAIKFDCRIPSQYLRNADFVNDVRTTMISILNSRSNNLSPMLAVEICQLFPQIISSLEYNIQDVSEKLREYLTWSIKLKNRTTGLNTIAEVFNANKQLFIKQQKFVFFGHEHPDDKAIFYPLIFNLSSFVVQHLVQEGKLTLEELKNLIYQGIDAENQPIDIFNPTVIKNKWLLSQVKAFKDLIVEIETNQAKTMAGLDEKEMKPLCQETESPVPAEEVEIPREKRLYAKGPTTGFFSHSSSPPKSTAAVTPCSWFNGALTNESPGVCTVIDSHRSEDSRPEFFYIPPNIGHENDMERFYNYLKANKYTISKVGFENQQGLKPINGGKTVQVMINGECKNLKIIYEFKLCSSERRLLVVRHDNLCIAIKYVSALHTSAAMDQLPNIVTLKIGSPSNPASAATIPGTQGVNIFSASNPSAAAAAAACATSSYDFASSPSFGKK